MFERPRGCSTSLERSAGRIFFASVRDLHVAVHLHAINLDKPFGLGASFAQVAFSEEYKIVL
jgi:hypothetical protein